MGRPPHLKFWGTVPQSPPRSPPMDNPTMYEYRWYDIILWTTRVSKPLCQATRPMQGYIYYEVDTDLKKLNKKPKDFECLDDGWKNKNCGALPLNQTWDCHQDKEATGDGVKISLYILKIF